MDDEETLPSSFSFYPVTVPSNFFLSHLIDIEEILSIRLSDSYSSVHLFCSIY